MTAPITVCIPHIPTRERNHLLKEALASVRAQTYPPQDVIVVEDHAHSGAEATRNVALQLAKTEWVAFLDDDDMLDPQHLDHLFACAEEAGADLVYPWFRLAAGVGDPLYVDGERAAFRPFDDKARDWLINRGNFIPITCLVRTELLLAVGGFQRPPFASPHNPCEDWGAWRAVALTGAHIVHLPERTWFWRHWHGHTAGRPWRA